MSLQTLSIPIDIQFQVVIARIRYLMKAAILGPIMVIALMPGWQNIARQAAAAEVSYYMKRMSWLTAKYFSYCICIRNFKCWPYFEDN